MTLKQPLSLLPLQRNTQRSSNCLVMTPIWSGGCWLWWVSRYSPSLWWRSCPGYGCSSSPTVLVAPSTTPSCWVSKGGDGDGLLLFPILLCALLFFHLFSCTLCLLCSRFDYTHSSWSSLSLPLQFYPSFIFILFSSSYKCEIGYFSLNIQCKGVVLLYSHPRDLSQPCLRTLKATGKSFPWDICKLPHRVALLSVLQRLPSGAPQSK